MMSFAGSNSADIILDSGADTSALRLSYIDVGESCSHETVGQDYIDAQGGKLDIRDTRLSESVSSLQTSAVLFLHLAISSGLVGSFSTQTTEFA